MLRMMGGRPDDAHDHSDHGEHHTIERTHPDPSAHPDGHPA
jgi:hypothetical protein